MKADSNESVIDGIAIIGMAGRFPQSDTIDQFWKNLIDGKDCISTLSIDDARAAGVPDSIINLPNYIRRGGRVKNPDLFDATFFGFSPKDAQLLDPQHRLFLQCGWEAIESAGYNLNNLNCQVGVFGGCNMNYYLINNLIANPGILSNYFELQTIFSSDKDFLATRLSYKFNLKGPSYTIQSACSSSLVAVHVACQNLLTYQCDMALAGGVSLQIPWWNGYIIGDADIRSTDGICRPFDKDANGTLFGEGTGIVVLKRLQEAIADNDTIYAVIKGSAINNDGSLKAGYTAPSIDGQVDAVTMALETAGISASDISYIETHGTGTPLGDPIEILALTKTFRQYNDKVNYCGIGSVKASIGHLDAAAGIASLIKTALALHHKELPASRNFSQPNPQLQLENSPFFVVKNRTPWTSPDGIKRRAGVSSLGVGGTNAHVILEEAPLQKATESSVKWHFFPVSAKTPVSLKKSAQSFADFFTEEQNNNLADNAFTLQQGRQHFPYRQFVVADSSSNCRQQFSELAKNELTTKAPFSESTKIVFMFSGQGSQYLNMTSDLYKESTVFKYAFDSCCDLLLKNHVADLRTILFSNDEENSSLIQQTNITQPLLFSIEYSLVKYWASLGIIPSALIGHSIGEYVAACISGVFTLEEAICIIAERGRIMYAQPPGKMLSINSPAKDIIPLLDSNIELALVNSPDLCVVAGEESHLKAFQSILSEKKIDSRILLTSHAFHSRLMDKAVKPFTDIMSRYSLKTPSIPFISNISGTWIDASAAQDPSYWGKHIRNTVNYSDGILKLLDDGYRVFLEIGPGNTLCTLVNRCASCWHSIHKEISDEIILTVPSVRHQKKQNNDIEFTFISLGQLWQNGIDVNWTKLYPRELRLRKSLPTYQFDEKRFWVDPDTSKSNTYKIPFGLMHTTGLQNTNEPQKSDKTENINSEQSENEQYLAAIWKDLLGVDIINPKDNFFELGGHSLLSIQMINRIKQETGIVIDNKEFLFNSFSQIIKKHSFKNINNSIITNETPKSESFGIKIKSLFKKK